MSNKKRPEIDLHFVNADNKQTVSRIRNLYRKLGVRCVGIVDFDVLNSKNEFKRQLDDLGLTEEKSTVALKARGEIAASVESVPPKERFQAVQRHIDELSDLVKSVSTGQEEELLPKVETLCMKIAGSTKAWKGAKERGIGALDQSVVQQFWDLYKLCSSEGLFINPKGELESMLSDHGIHHSTDKREWFELALVQVSGLTVDDTKYPWKLLDEIHQQLRGEKR